MGDKRTYVARQIAARTGRAYDAVLHELTAKRDTRKRVGKASHKRHRSSKPESE